MTVIDPAGPPGVPFPHSDDHGSCQEQAATPACFVSLCRGQGMAGQVQASFTRHYRVSCILDSINLGQGKVA